MTMPEASVCFPYKTRIEEYHRCTNKKNNYIYVHTYIYIENVARLNILVFASFLAPRSNILGMVALSPAPGHVHFGLLMRWSTYVFVAHFIRVICVLVSQLVRQS